MKKFTSICLVLLASLSLAACSQAKNKTATKPSSSTSKSSSSSKASQSSSSSSSSEVDEKTKAENRKKILETFKNMGDDASSLNLVPDTAGVPEWESFKTIKVVSPQLLKDEQGSLKTDSATSYDEIVNKFGSPLHADEQNRVYTWQSPTATIIVQFTDTNSAKQAALRFDDFTTNTNEVANVKAGDKAQNVLNKLGRPHTVSLTSASTSMSWVNEAGEEYHVLFRKDTVAKLLTPAELATAQE
ncbi:hypothetical protein [Streptococcus oricebi]|uniref:Lipoprotein n=1 Tax=Streptococcus oricebi TaxID=1547447 RepID=A0ABS5B5Y9_9STRE|nr:hypothetical protein [Streptococcus oricebi]MBP2623868.1 hypothetical protein [Streptococcus oricebi]